MKWIHKKSYTLIFLFPIIFAVGAAIGLFSNKLLPDEDRSFEQFTEAVFRAEINSNTLNLHYTLAHPENYGITQTLVTLGNLQQEPGEANAILENYEEKLRSFSYEKLNEDNQITRDMLLLYFHTQKEGSNYELLEEVLSPTLGIQAQLPVLLAEYPFYDRDDIEDYLTLLSQVDTYFQSILQFEEQKVRQGYFMNDTSLADVISQCQEFIRDPAHNYLQEIFEDKISGFPSLSEKERENYLARHETALSQHVLPAYETLIVSLSKWKGRCKNKNGLSYYPDGKDYYRYLLKTQVGVYENPDVLRQRLYTQLIQDYERLGALVQSSPELLATAQQNDFRIKTPEQALLLLQKASQKDFPHLSNVDYEVKYVHESLQKYLSPAFYLTPPIDTLSPNTIYINPADQTSDLELFATLGHEGFPGHLYQTLYFGQSQPADIRYLPNFGGYVEGWATYIEAYAYSYADVDSSVTDLLWLNRSINLCLYSILDLGIHYYGWTLESVTHYLSNFGIKDSLTIREIHQRILESPVNYLKYYMGYLNFLDLRKEMQVLMGDDFKLIDFHQQVLDIGPVQFPVLRKYLNLMG